MEKVFLGIDVAKDEVEVFLKVANRGFGGTFNNNPAGFNRLHNWLTKKARGFAVHVCMEATGSYWDELATYLHGKGLAVSVVNPVRIKRYGESKLQRNKTDKADAALIADFCQNQQPPVWEPQPAEYRSLRNLTRRLDDLIALRTQEKNRLKANPSKAIQVSIERVIATLDQEIAQVEVAIEELVKLHPTLQEKVSLLRSIKGIGWITAVRLLAELPDISHFSSADQLVAFAGLNPKITKSGASVRGKSYMGKMGRSNIRAALYFPAVTAIRFNRLIIPLAERLASKGKHNSAIIGAAMRKLIRFVYGVLKHNRPFDPDFLAKNQIAS